MNEKQCIQWFPGHMTKALRKIKEDLKLVDIVSEVIDSRIPISSRNPDLDKIIQDKPRVIVMNKCDMADPSQTNRWLKFYEQQKDFSVPVDCKSGNGIKEFRGLITHVLEKKISSWKNKGIINRRIRIMIVGVPNVGKSTFINRITQKTKAKAENRPGVTKGNQWFSAGKDIDVLDTPGVLWPRFESKIVGENLAFTGAVKDQVIDTEELSLNLLDILMKFYPNRISEYFNLDKNFFNELNSYDCLSLIAKRRGMLLPGGSVDISRASIAVLEEFRCAKLGRITLERLG